jgi:DNA polymerase epsilon subunit 2
MRAGRAPKEPSIAPPATSKARYLRDRYNIIKQVILRNEHFSPPAVVDVERTDYMKVRIVSSMLRGTGLMEG